MLLRNSTSGAFQVYNIAPNNNNITGSASLGTVGLNWQVAGFGNFASLGETDMILRDSNSGGFQVYDIKNNQITGSAFMGAVGLNWQFSGIGNFSGRGDQRHAPARRQYRRTCRSTTSATIRSPALPSSARSGWIGSSRASAISAASPAKAICLLRNINTGGLQVYDINNNQITGAAFLGTVGVDWQFAGVAPIKRRGDLRPGVAQRQHRPFQVYNIANNQITGSAAWGRSGWIGSSVASLPRHRPIARPTAVIRVATGPGDVVVLARCRPLPRGHRARRARCSSRADARSALRQPRLNNTDADK